MGLQHSCILMGSFGENSAKLVTIPEQEKIIKGHIKFLTSSKSGVITSIKTDCPSTGPVSNITTMDGLGQDQKAGTPFRPHMGEMGTQVFELSSGAGDGRGWNCSSWDMNQHLIMYANFSRGSLNHCTTM